MLKKRFSILAFVSAVVLALALAPVDSGAAGFADGTYDVPYEMKEANNNNTSIADGYFQSPAKVTINGETATVEFTVTSADMVQDIGVPGSSVNVVSESGDARTYSFQTSASNLSSPITMDMHIIVPDIPEMPGGYDRQHQARADFNVSGIDQGGKSTKTNDDEENGEAAGDKDKNADNPKTGDDSPIVMYTILLIGAAGAFVLVRKLRPAND